MNVFITVSDRVDLSIRGKGKNCQIDCILGQSVKVSFGIFCVHPTFSANLVDGSLEGDFGLFDAQKVPARVTAPVRLSARLIMLQQTMLYRHRG